MVYDHLGNPFETVQKMCDKYGIRVITYYYRLNHGMNKEKALTTPVNKNRATNRKVGYVYGYKYDELEELCKDQGISIKTYKNKRKRGLSHAEALANNELGKGMKKKSFDHLEQEFESQIEMCRHWGISQKNYITRRKHGWSIQEALETPVKQIISANTNAKVPRISIHKALDSIKPFNIKYSSLGEMVSKLGINDAQLLRVRLTNIENIKQIDIELIASIPRINNIKLEIIGLDGQARYKAPWMKDLQTTRQIIEHERPDLLELYDKAHPKGEWNPYRREGD